MQQTIQGLNSLILEQDPASPAPAPSPAPTPAPAGESHGYFPLRADTLGKNDAPPALPGLGLPDEAPPQADGEARLASAAVQAGTLLAEDSSEAGINYARSLGEGLINQQINDWLNQYGNARVSVGTQRTFSGDMLVPVYETDSSLFFTQLGGRTNQERNTLNLGLGYRWYPGDWLLGVNAFYDYDLTGKNKRFGIGAEAWRDYLKLSANGYIRGTDWHQSPLKSMEDYDERPANGFDLRVNAYLPSWPQLGGSLKYEQYFGKG
ncbi:inverse autotransporter beta domain-containing protein, partial [Kalamiella sp. sgz302252]|uniref:inverse autotransporter beta domain-containing protein n=1 Tax=Pantoea sp. sgz302252 TaxID=3341827 RepID=UPI0036D3FF94